jgi:serine/threonine protein kinase
MKDDKPVIAADAPQAADEKTVIMTGAMLPNDDKTVIIHRQQLQTVTDQALGSVPDDSTVIMGAPPAQPLVENTDERAAIEAAGSQSATIQAPSAQIAETTISGAAHQNPTQAMGVGSVIRGRFELVSELGEGGMGSVYRAIDRRKKEAEDDNPYIAIKLLSGDFKQHPRAFITLQRETKKTQALAHPNIVTVFDFDREGDTIYMTMEELKGQTLEDIIHEGQRKGIKQSVALNIIRGIAAGLAYAHSKGIVHSDLKPGNIFVTDQGQVKVLDFGIARVVDSESSNDRFDVGELGALTPTYASIEMIDHRPPSPKDDLYALGVIACELLGDAHPYKRMMATEALAQKMPPNLPKVGFLLKKVLARAVALEASDRAESCAKWLSQLEFATGGYRKWLVASVVALVLVIANAFYIGEVAQPEVALTDLSQEQQVSFTSYMEEASMALEFEDINGALFSLDKAYKIHAENEQISEFISAIMEYIETLANQGNLSGEQLAEVVGTLGAYRAFENDRIQQELQDLLN